MKYKIVPLKDAGLTWRYRVKKVNTRNKALVATKAVQQNPPAGIVIISIVLASLVFLQITIPHAVSFEELIFWEKSIRNVATSVAWHRGGVFIAIGLGWSYAGVAVYDLNGNYIAGFDAGPPEGSYGAVYGVDWSPDGRKLVAVAGYRDSLTDVISARILIISAYDWKIIYDKVSEGDEFFGVRWSPLGDAIAVTTYWSKLLVFDANGELLWETDKLGGSITGVDWDANGTRIAVASHRNIFVFDRHGNHVYKTPTYVGTPYRSLDWSPNGELIAAGSDDYIVIIKAQNGELVSRIPVITLGDPGNREIVVSEARDLRWSPDSSHILVLLRHQDTGENYFHELVLVDLNGNVLWSSGLLLSYAEALDWYYGGNLVAVGASNKLSVIDVSPLLPYNAGGYTVGNATVFGELVVRGPPGTLLVISQVGTTESTLEPAYEMPGDGALSLRLPEGEYVVKYELPEGILSGLIGDASPELLKGVLKTVIKAGEITELNLPGLGDLVSWIELRGPVGTVVTIRWNQTWETLTIPEKGYAEAPIMPGNYIVEAVFPYVGTPLVNTEQLVYVSPVEVLPGSRMVVDLSPFAPGVLEIVNPNPVPSWVEVLEDNNGTTRFINNTIIAAASLERFAMPPGSYYLSYKIPLPKVSIIGDVYKELAGNQTFEISPLTATTIQLPEWEDHVGRLKITVGSHGKLTVMWANDNRSIQNLAPGSEIGFLAAPGEYRIFFEYDLDKELLDSPVIAIMGYSAWESSVTVKSGEVAEVIVPRLNELYGFIELDVSAGLSVVIRNRDNTTTLDTLGYPQKIVVIPGVYEIEIQNAHNTTLLKRIITVNTGETIKIEYKPEQQASNTLLPSFSSPPVNTTTPPTTIPPGTTTIPGTLEASTTPGMSTPPLSSKESNTPVSTQTPQEVGTTDATEGSDSPTLQAPASETSRQYLPTQLTASLIVLAGLASALMVYGQVIRKRRISTTDSRKPPTEEPVWRHVARVLGKPLPRVQNGPECGESFRTQIPETVLPHPYNGSLDCCSLGCGGWGCAFKCFKRGENLPDFVIKIPKAHAEMLRNALAETVSKRMVDNIVEKALPLTRIEHPHIIKMLAVSKTAPILVYEYADNGTLYYQLNKGMELDAKDVITLGIQLGDALRLLHTRGLVHGDIKPMNIFIKQGVAKLGDFSSIMRLFAQTSGSSMASTPGWRAPEQVYSDLMLSASKHGMENRIDVYQLGNLLLYLLTGNTLDGEEAAVQEKAERALRLLDDTRVPAELAKLVREMLSLRPEERPGMEEVVRRLVGLLNYG